MIHALRSLLLAVLLVPAFAVLAQAPAYDRYVTTRSALEMGDAAGFQKGLKELAAAKDPEARCLAAVLQGYALMGAQDYGRALDVLAEAEQEAGTLFGTFSAPHMDAITFLSWCHGYSGNMDEELRLNQLLLEHYRTDPERYAMEIADTYNTIAINHGLRGDRYMEMRMAQQGLDLLHGRVPDTPEGMMRHASVRWTLLNSYALATLNIGQYGSARMAAHECRRILSQLDPSSTQMSISDQVIARCWWMAERDIDSCLHYIDMAIGRLAGNQRPDQPGKGSAPWFSYTSFKADFLLQAGRVREALRTAGEAETLLTPAHFAAPGFRESALKLLLTKDLALLADGQLDEAQRMADRLRGQLPVARNGRTLLEFKWALVQLDIHEARGEHRKAFALIDSLTAHNTLLGGGDVQGAAFGEGASVVDVLTHFGTYHLRRAQADTAAAEKERSLAIALELLERAFAWHVEQQIALDAGSPADQWSFGNLDPVDALLTALGLRNERDPNAATRAAEVLARAKGLLLGNQQWMEEEYARVLPVEAENERLRLRAAVFSASSAYANTSLPEHAGALIAARAAYARYVDQLERDHADLARRPTADGMCNIVEAARQRKALVLDYYLGKRDLYIVRATSEGVRFERREGSGRLRKLILEHRNSALDAGRWSSGLAHSPDDAGDLEAIRAMVLGGILDAVPDTRSLIVIPHDALFLLNFELLPSGTGSGRFLIEDHVVTYALGAAMLCRPERERRTGPLHAGVFSASSYGGLPQDDQFVHAVTRGGFFDLTGAAREGEAIAALFNGTHVAHATAADFLARAGEFGLLHVGAHGFGHPDGAASSFLLFEGTNAWHDRVTGAQVAGMDLAADLVVLSACNTGVGAMRGLEGTASLARAFLYAGSRSVVSGLWQVPDARTSDLMIAFHRYLSKGMGRAEALRQAKLDHLHSHDGVERAPYYWAGFVLYGDDGPLVQPPRYRGWWWVALLLPVIGVLYYRSSRRARRSAAR